MQDKEILDNEPVNLSDAHLETESANSHSSVVNETITADTETETTTYEAKLNIENDESEKLKKENSDLKDKYLRLAAEFDNYRKRTLKERMDLIKSAGEDVLISILPVVDNFDRAMKAMSDTKEIGAVKDGIELIYQKFKEFLSQKGIKEIDAAGNTFDTDLHEAITKISAPTPESKGKIVDVVEKGYTLNDKVIRFAKVVIGE